MTKKFISKFIIFVSLSISQSIFSQDLIPLIYKGYVTGNTGSGLNGVYDIRLMVLNPVNEDDILWSRIFLDVNIRYGFYEIDMEDRTNTVRKLFNQGNDLLFKSVILDLSLETSQYLSKNFQQIAIQEGTLFAENYPTEQVPEEIPELPFMPIKYICTFESIPLADDAVITIKIVNYGSKSTIIRIIFYHGTGEKKIYEFSLDTKSVWNEIVSNFDSNSIREKGFIEILSNDNQFIVNGSYNFEINDTSKTTELNWRQIK